MAGKSESKAPDGAKTAEPAKSASFTSPWGTKVTVDAELADLFKDAGYKPAK